MHADPAVAMQRDMVMNNIYMGEGSLDSFVGGQEVSNCVILVLRECIWNVPVVWLVLPVFDDTSSQGLPPNQVVYTT